MAELALDDVEWDALAGRLDGVRVAELVRRDAAPAARCRREAPQGRAGRRGRPRSPGGRAIRWRRRSDAGGPANGSICSQAQRSMPTSRRSPPLPRRTRTPPVARCRSLSARASASLIRRPARHSKTISVLVRNPYGVPPAQRMIPTSSSTRRRVGRVTKSSVTRRMAAAMAGHGRGRATTASRVELNGRSHVRQRPRSATARMGSGSGAGREARRAVGRA